MPTASTWSVGSTASSAASSGGMVTDAGGEHLVGVVLSSHASPVEPSSFSQDDLFRALFDDAPIPITIQDENFRLIDVNAACENWLGYSRDELIGKSHNLVRHPDMPMAAFKDLGTTVQSGMPWRGLVKNRCKNGDFYWVEAFVVPLKKNGQLP